MAEGDGMDGASGAVTTQTVFLSYASHDTQIANTVCRELESRGLRCWIAPRDVAPGALYADAIVRAINDSKVLLIVLSQSAVASSHVGREIERAASKHKQIIALRIDTAPLSPALEYFLSESQWIDVPALGMPAALSKLANAVEQGPMPSHLNPVDDRVVKVTTGTGARRVVAAVAVVIVITVGIGLGIRFWGPQHRVTQVTAVEASLGTGELGTAPISEKSIAVLPFTDMSEKKDQEYFSDGMAEEIINLLVKIPELIVPARTSSFYFKGKSIQIPEIAKQLGVRNILEGSVRKSGSHLRVTAQLVRADNGYHLWSETYDRSLDDVFKTQDEIADAVVKALKVSILKAEVTRVPPTANNEAYTLFLQAQSLARRGNSADSLAAEDDLQRAVRLDPQFALAWAALAELFTDDTVDWGRQFASLEHPEYRSGEDTTDYGAIERRIGNSAREAANRALTLAPNSPEVHRATGRVRYWTDWNWQAADAELKVARDLDPGDAGITEAAASLAVTMGRFDEGLKLATRAVAQDPLGTAYWDIGAANHRLGGLDEAAAAFKHLIELYPTASAYHFRYALVLLSQHNAQAALDEIQRDDSPAYRHAGSPLALDALGRRNEADRELSIAESKWGGMAYQISYVYAARNNTDRAMYWLERAYRQHDGGLLSMKDDPMLKNLEHDPRYKALIRKMNLPE
ncbi:MAG TPA: TIR domain-containing protein [Steroidobacteraceae bacterium]|nr:TIR domain-containing protein [Steroidobacteraceae bacterium]